MNLFVKGRKDVFKTLQLKINEDDQTIWFHCASLGEYEQGLPIMESVKKKFPNHKLVLTFFSPSGYEIKKNSSIADVVSYLPLDTPRNSKKFIKIVHPTLAIFIKYEFWPNYLFQLQKNNISSLLVSGLFRKSQVFFKYYGGFMRKALSRFDHLFVQDELSIALLHSIDIKNVSISGDTRFDRVSNQLKHDNSLAFIKHFKEDSLCIVCGSTWPEDEAVLLDYINTASKNVKFIIAPHNIDTTKIEGGFSFYEAGYTEIQPWLILKTKNINNLNNEIKYTPTLRLINKSIFMDAGVSTDGDAAFHFMYTF